MNYEEMNNTIMTYCQKRSQDCNGCPLNLGTGICYYTSSEDMDESDKAYILRNYSLITNNSVNHPSHYNHGGYECIDVMQSVFGTDSVKEFCLNNAFKYMFRCKHKSHELEDIKKADWYLRHYIELSGDFHDLPG